MRQYKPNFTAKKAQKIIFKIVKQTTNAMYKDTFDIVLDNFFEFKEENALITTVHSQVRENLFNILSDFTTEIIEFVGNYLSFGISPEIKDNLINKIEEKEKRNNRKIGRRLENIYVLFSLT